MIDSIVADKNAVISSEAYIPCHRSRVHGVGITDCPVPVSVNGKHIKSYNAWRHMLQRCYSASYQKEHSTYVGCHTSEEWHLFSNFERWYTENYIEGYSLDKDLLVPGNKLYSADTCVFISPALNTLLTDGRGQRGLYPLGVFYSKGRRNYQAQVRAGGKPRHIGCFCTPAEAHKAWQLAKADILASFPTDDPRVRVALDLRVEKLRFNAANGIETVKL